jgi:hypothetical protein
LKLSEEIKAHTFNAGDHASPWNAVDMDEVPDLIGRVEALEAGQLSKEHANALLAYIVWLEDVKGDQITSLPETLPEAMRRLAEIKNTDSKSKLHPISFRH